MWEGGGPEIEIDSVRIRIKTKKVNEILSANYNYKFWSQESRRAQNWCFKRYSEGVQQIHFSYIK